MPIDPRTSSPSIDGPIDFIGDIHGYAERLEQLLKKLGYENRNGCHQHPERIVVFLGDYIDRGPEIRRTLQIVRDMVNGGSAIALMGNHEYNALAWFTPRPGFDGMACRRHTPARLEAFNTTLNALDQDMDEWLEWFRDRPLWIDAPRFRAVHASWDETSCELLGKGLRRAGNRLDSELVLASSVPGSETYQAIELLLKGREIDLPPGFTIDDHQGHVRHRTRIRWFERPNGRGYHEYTLGAGQGLPTDPVPESLVEHISPYPPDAPPVFFGHYWMADGSPAPLASNVACLDWSVTAGGPLVAYRYDGESPLTAGHFVLA